MRKSVDDTRKINAGVGLTDLHCLTNPFIDVESIRTSEPLSRRLPDHLHKSSLVARCIVKIDKEVRKRGIARDFAVPDAPSQDVRGRGGKPIAGNVEM